MSEPAEPNALAADFELQANRRAELVRDMARDGAAPMLDRALRLVNLALDCDGSALIMLRDGRSELLVSTRPSIVVDLDQDGYKTLSQAARRGLVVREAHKNPDYVKCPFINDVAGWQSLRAASIVSLWPQAECVLLAGALGEPSKEMLTPPQAYFLAREVLADEITLLNDMLLAERSPLGDEQLAQPQCEPETAPVLSHFLSSTLIEQPRSLTRSDVTYFAMRRWRRSVKNEQIAALRAFKETGNTGLLASLAADDIARWVERSVGTPRFDAVVPVPCGHSGAGCLSERIAEAVAERGGWPFARAFDPLPVKGSSHPKTNVRRPAMRLREETPGNSVLLVDDVATSGAHIVEAANKLRAKGVSVVSVAWIANG